MIKSVKISNFKGLNSFNLDNISRINLIGGKNNAGKTTIIEALFMFFDRLNPNMLLRQYNWRGVNELPLTPDAIFSPIFNNFDMTKDIVIEVTNEKSFNETMNIAFVEDGERSIKMNSTDGQIRTDENILNAHSLKISYKSSKYKEQRVELRLDKNGLTMDVENGRNHDVPAYFLSSKYHVSSSENAVRYGELDIKGQTDIIVELLRLIEPRLKSISSIALPNGTSMLYANIGIGVKLPITYMGDGISRLLTILLAIISTKNGVVLIDEIENGIHYSVLPDIWRIISSAAIEHNVQIFATTHSYECLNASIEGIENDAKEEFRYYRVEKSKVDNRLTTKPFNFEVLKTAIHRGWEVR